MVTSEKTLSRALEKVPDRISKLMQNKENKHA